MQILALWHPLRWYIHLQWDVSTRRSDCGLSFSPGMFWLWHYWTVGDLKDLDLFTVNILAGTNHLFWLTAILVYKYTFGSRIFVIISRAHHQMGSPAEVQLAGVWGKMEFHNILQILPLTASPVLPATQIVETAGSGTSLDIGGYCGSYNLPRGKFLPHSYLVHNKDIHFLKKGAQDALQMQQAHVILNKLERV